MFFGLKFENVEETNRGTTQRGYRLQPIELCQAAASPSDVRRRLRPAIMILLANWAAPSFFSLKSGRSSKISLESFTAGESHRLTSDGEAAKENNKLLKLVGWCAQD